MAGLEYFRGAVVEFSGEDHRSLFSVQHPVASSLPKVENLSVTIQHETLPVWAHGDRECEILYRLRGDPDLLEAVARAQGSEFARQKQLRQQFPDDLVRAALTLVDLRRKGAAKFRQSSLLWLERQGLEQATSEEVARHKAARFAGDVWDLCSGIGSDAAALSRVAQVTSFDLQPAMCLRTLWNAEVLGDVRQLTVECRDVYGLDVAQRLIHVDPDRRPEAQGRALKIEDYVPGLDALQTMVQSARGGAIKLSPASNFGGKFPAAEVELISLHGECKEATIWFGELAGTAPYRATVLPSGQTLAGHPLESLAARAPLGRYLFDPDPAIVRAGLVDLLAETLRLSRLDDAEEYLTGDAPVVSPFVQTFEVLSAHPNQEREYRQALRAADFGSIEIKCRHIPVSADQLRRKLPRGAGEPGVLLFVREQGKARVVLARRVRNTNAREEVSPGVAT